MGDAAREAPEIQRRGQRMVEAETPVEVLVWIDSHRSRWHQHRGWAVAWTETQVRVRYIDDHEREGPGVGLAERCHAGLALLLTFDVALHLLAASRGCFSFC
ncbi:hypothetical protein C8046_16635 [Serinibacter arcticus]|uniref:Uncharacterized protein n=1 Tax=Serinibacter arcticus TaxID=1655435 RepID=A0A2U1ZYG3_9MICO|nr:hypothetical protein C8046_16635 [Serinibacter arcticus]